MTFKRNLAYMTLTVCSTSIDLHKLIIIIITLAQSARAIDTIFAHGTSDNYLVCTDKT